MSTGGRETNSVATTAEQELRTTIQESCYANLSHALLNKESWSNQTELATGSRMTAEAHQNRTVLELVQNARDAIRKGGSDDDQREGSIAVVVGPEKLYVANTGKPFRLDREDILNRVRRLGEGKVDKETIGEKGVGMRSIMALGNRFGIHSAISEETDKEHLSVEFTASQAWAMLVRRYLEVIKADSVDLEAELGGDETPRYGRYLEAMVERIDAEGVGHPLLGESQEWPDVNDIIGEGLSNRAPSPQKVIEDLPDLSPFRYPVVREETEDDAILNTLLGRKDSYISTNAGLADQVSEEQYTTVVTVDYTDEAWSSLLKHAIDAGAEVESDIELPVEEWRERRTSEVGDAQRNKQIWAECEDTITAEVLILLEKIEHVDLVRLTDYEGDPEASDHYEISNGERSTVEDSDSLTAQQVTVKSAPRSESLSNTDFTATFQLYTKPWGSTLVDEDANDQLKILYEQPQSDGHWAPAPQPLHLYYPIEEETTPYPFIVHAPFEVQMDRQHLDTEHQRNQELLEEGVLREFVGATVKHILKAESDLRKWLPWLVMPLLTNDASGPESSGGRRAAVSTFVAELCDELEATSFVPTIGGGKATPGQVLLEVADFDLEAFDSDFRLEAFEPLRNNLPADGQYSIGRLPEKAVIDAGQTWLEAVREQGRLPGDQLQTAAARIGISKLLDRQSGDDGEGRDGEPFVSVLDEVWGMGKSDGVSVADVDPEQACMYFETLVAHLTGENSTGARQLGERRIPVIPALNYSDGASDSCGENSETAGINAIGHLARAQRRNSDAGANRTVFYEDSSETDRRIGPPPSNFDVFVVPYVGSWYSDLDDNAEAWDTTKFDSDTDIYRRVASELGGYPNRATQQSAVDPKALKYLYEGYKQTAGREETRAALFNPLPYQGLHYHTDFSNSAARSGIGDLLEGAKFDRIQDENFLRERYIDQIHLRSREGEGKPAAELSFGQDWADLFRLVADVLEDERISDALEDGGVDAAFVDARLPDAGRAVDFRRWALAVESAVKFRADDAPTLASPETICSDLTAQSSTERVGRMTPTDAYWLLNFLLHIGVQVGPRIEWGWLDPANRGELNRRPRSLSYEEAKTLSDGKVPTSDATELPFTPSAAVLKRHANICRGSQNHPAFAAGHANDCQESSEQQADEWEVYKGAHDGTSRLAIPMWWQFADVPSEANLETAQAFRNAVLLTWPELSDRLFPAGWACAGAFGGSHQVKSPNRRIPSLGLVQLREASIWPSESEGEIESSRDLLKAPELGDKKTKNLPQLDWETLTACVEEEGIDIETLAPKEEVRQELGIAVDGVGPATAAERLDTLLKRYDDEGYSSFRTDAFRLLREFNNAHHLDALSKGQQRQWKRRDIFYTKTRVFVNQEGTQKPHRIGVDEGAELAIYTQPLPQFAREQVENDPEKRPFIELPSRNPGPIATILTDKEADGFEFGIQSPDQPDRPVAKGEPVKPLDGLRTALDERVADLAAAYAAERRDEIEAADVQAIERQLDSAVENLYVVSPEHVDGESGDAASVAWEPADENTTDPVGIALLEGAVDGDFEPHHMVDALVHIVDNEDVRDKFEVVLRATPPMNRYTDIRGQYELGERKQRALSNLHDVLPALLSALTDESPQSRGDILSVPDDEEERKSRYDDLRAFASDGHRSAIINEYLTTLARDRLSESQAEACLRAGIQLALLNDQRGGLAMLIDEFVAEQAISVAGLEAVGESIETVDLTDWQSLQEPSLQRYLTAVAMVEEFYSRVDTDADKAALEEDSNAAISSENELRPAPLNTFSEVLPASVHEGTGLEEFPVIALGLHDDLDSVSVTTEQDSEYPLQRAVIDWADGPHSELADTVGGGTLQDFFGQPLAECLAAASPLQSVKDALQTRAQVTAKQHKRTRKQKARAYDNGEKEYATEMAGSDSDVGGLEFPSVGGSRPGPASASEVAGNGRDGELACIQAAWEQFDDAGPRQPTIIKAVRDWRQYGDSNQWRLKATEKTFEEVTEFDGSGAFDFETFRERVCDEDEATDDRKRWFRLLVDTSEESGPGFDYIDPFGTHYGPDANPRAWEPTWMRRVEVKSIDGSPSDGYRVTLTGNEFRMARRTYANTTERRYLVRLVFGHRSDDGDFKPTQLRNIEKVIDRYGSDGESAQKTAWDALRGGRVPLSGEFD